MVDKIVVWEGDSLEVLQSFPDGVKQNIGSDLRRLQRGKIPRDSKPLKTVAQGVYELRDEDFKGWYRVVCYLKVKKMIYILHSFIKKSRKTPKKELDKARIRLLKVEQRVREKRV